MRFVLLLVISLLQLGSYLLFCKGFFPTKVLLSPGDLVNFTSEIPIHYNEPKPQFNKLIFMVVDALRADFMFSNTSDMYFTHKLLNSGYGVGFTAYSNPPTVTLPRLKGITTGSTPNFIDAVLNIAEEDTSSTLGDQDSWIKQMNKNGWKINMFGDDTWLKLFPEYFTKTDGTASFYVSDFTIVDNNVTRHLDFELSAEGRSQWDCLILHYLGLDHIGHKGGPMSANMPKKQQEMDQIVSRIFNSVVSANEETLFVVMGDHGMNEVGNHGGSSIGEVSAALSLFSPKFKKAGVDFNSNVKAPIQFDPEFNYFQKIDQIDLVPTLATMLGLDIPINNLGRFIPSLLDIYKSEEEKLNVLIKNALQLKVLLDKSRGVVTNLDHDISDMTSKEELINYISMAKETLSKTSSDYNYTDITYALIGYLLTTLVALAMFVTHNEGSWMIKVADISFSVIYALNFFGSSMIEEEHHLWWFFTTIFVAYVIIKAVRDQPGKRKMVLLYSLILLGSLRVLKAWNNSGQKNNLKVNIKIGTYIESLAPGVGPLVMATLLVSTFVPFVVLVQRGYPGDDTVTNNSRFMAFMSVSMLAIISTSVKFLSYLTESFDLSGGYATMPAWCNSYIDWLISYSSTSDFNQISQILCGLFHKVWLASFLFFLLKPLVYKTISARFVGNYINDLLVVVTMQLINQTNFLNVPIFAVLLTILLSFSKLVPGSISSSNTYSIFVILLQNLSFFQYGSTNSLSSVDLTNSFNGLTSYNMVLVGILTFIANWSSPIFWSLGYLKLSLDSLASPDNTKSKVTKWDLLYNRLIFNLVFYSISGLILIASCFSLRFHLFIWTVFSPKLLYFLSWFGCGLLVDFLFCSLVTALYLD